MPFDDWVQPYEKNLLAGPAMAFWTSSLQVTIRKSTGEFFFWGLKFGTYNCAPHYSRCGTHLNLTFDLSTSSTSIRIPILVLPFLCHFSHIRRSCQNLESWFDRLERFSSFYLSLSCHVADYCKVRLS